MEIAAAAASRYGWSWEYIWDGVPLSVLVLLLGASIRQERHGESSTWTMAELDICDYVDEHGWDPDAIKAKFFGDDK